MIQTNNKTYRYVVRLILAITDYLHRDVQVNCGNDAPCVRVTRGGSIQLRNSSR